MFSNESFEAQTDGQLYNLIPVQSYCRSLVVLSEFIRLVPNSFVIRVTESIRVITANKSLKLRSSEFSVINVYAHLAHSVSFCLCSINFLYLSFSYTLFSIMFCFLISLTSPLFLFFLYLYLYLVTYHLFCLTAELSNLRRVAFLYCLFTLCSGFSCCSLVWMVIYTKPC